MSVCVCVCVRVCVVCVLCVCVCECCWCVRAHGWACVRMGGQARGERRSHGGQRRGCGPVTSPSL